MKETYSLPEALEEHREGLVTALGAVAVGLAALQQFIGPEPEPAPAEVPPSELAEAFSSNFRTGLAEYEAGMLEYIAEYEAMVAGEQARLGAEVAKAKEILLGRQEGKEQAPQEAPPTPPETGQGPTE